MDEGKTEELETEIRQEYFDKICALIREMSIEKLRYYYTYITEYEKE